MTLSEGQKPSENVNDVSQNRYLGESFCVRHSPEAHFGASSLLR